MWLFPARFSLVFALTGQASPLSCGHSFVGFGVLRCPKRYFFLHLPKRAMNIFKKNVGLCIAWYATLSLMRSIKGVLCFSYPTEPRLLSASVISLGFYCVLWRSWLRGCQLNNKFGAPHRTRTCTGVLLRHVPLPIGLMGQGL